MMAGDIAVGHRADCCSDLCHPPEGFQPGEHPIHLSDLAPEVRALLEAALALDDSHSGPCAAAHNCEGYRSLGAASFAFAASVRRGGP